MAAALEYGRRTGGPALRELTFHQRAALLKSLGSMLREHREELYALSARTGATLCDAKFDVDGGIGVLLSYASKARRELPNDTVYAEGAVEPLGKGGQFLGQHILTPLHGVAVQINAVQLPGLGPAGEVRPGVHRGRAQPGQARQPDRLPDRAAGRADRRVRPAAGRLACSWSAAAPATCSTTSASRTWSAFTGSAVDRPAAARAPGRGGPLGPVQRRGRLAELLDPRAGRGAGHARVRPVRQAAGRRDDGQGGTEVHRDPARAGARRAGGRGHRRGRAAGWPRSWSATRPSEGVRMGALASREQREEVRRSVKRAAVGRTAGLR